MVYWVLRFLRRAGKMGGEASSRRADPTAPSCPGQEEEKPTSRAGRSLREQQYCPRVPRANWSRGMYTKQGEGMHSGAARGQL